MGHTITPDGVKSVSAVNYLEDMELTAIYSAMSADDEFVFSFSGIDGSFIRKTYHGTNYYGNDHVIRITVETSLDHDILNEDGQIGSKRVNDALSGAVVDGVVDKLALLNNAKENIEGVFSYLENIEDRTIEMPWISQLKGALPHFSVGAVSLISGERFKAENVDVTGPVQTGLASVALSPILLAADSERGALLIGASGVTNALTAGGSPLQLQGTSEVLIGGAGDDILLLGSGNHIDAITGAVTRNIANGGFGSDILVGDLLGSAEATLIGGPEGSPDIYIPGSGSDYIIGHGAPTDLVSYAHSNAGVQIDLSDLYQIVYKDSDGILQSQWASAASGGYADGDMLVGVNIIIGSEYSDRFTGVDGPTTSFIGGAGNDTFELAPGNNAVGGEGADSFYISSVEGSWNNYYLYGVDASDKVFIDGELYTGRTLTIEPKEWGYEVVSDDSVWGPVYGDPNSAVWSRYDRMFYAYDESGEYSNAAFIAFDDASTGTRVNLWMYGYDKGDAGITYELDYPVMVEGSPLPVIETTDGDTRDGWWASQESDWSYNGPGMISWDPNPSGFAGQLSTGFVGSPSLDVLALTGYSAHAHNSGSLEAARRYSPLEYGVEQYLSEAEPLAMRHELFIA
jgi:uncharacterized protein